MDWITYGFEREVARLLSLPAFGPSEERCLALGGHMGTPLAAGEVLSYGQPGGGYRLVRCVRCGLSERRLVLDEERE